MNFEFFIFLFFYINIIVIENIITIIVKRYIIIFKNNITNITNVANVANIANMALG